jgi:5-methylcytosine-specific restriction protein A
MPPRKICSAPGCEEVATPGGPHCEEHAARVADRLAARKAEAKRSDHALAFSALYADPRWRRAARRYLDRHPLCADCGELGAVEAATEVDHIVPHRGDAQLFWDRSNWQPLCHRCHSRKTAREVFHGKGGGV